MAALIIGVRRLGSVQKQNTSGFTALASAAASRALLRVAELGGGVVEALGVNVADAGDLELGVGIEGGGVVHAALAHADDEDGVTSHRGLSIGLGIIGMTG